MPMTTTSASPHSNSPGSRSSSSEISSSPAVSACCCSQQVPAIIGSGGGYRACLATGDVADHLRCEFCKKLLRQPWQLSCGHRLCATCLSAVFRSSESEQPKCPVDGTAIQKEETFHDVFAEREVMGLVVYCPTRRTCNGSGRCAWQGELRLLKDHEEVCDFMTRLCPNGCGEEIVQKDMADHLTQRCQARQLPCKYCQEPVVLKFMADHETSCPEAPAACPNGCSVRMFARKQMVQHLTVCEKQVVKCFYHQMGCDFEGPRGDLPGHHETSMAYHLQICCTQAQTNQVKVGQLSQQNSMLAEKCSSLESDFKRLKALVESSLMSNSHHLPVHVKAVSGGSDSGFTSDYTAGEATGSSRIQQAVESLEQLTTAQEQRLVSVERSVALHDIQLSEMDIRQNLQETKMSNGVLVWKISEFRRRQQEAISGKTPSLFSPPFYTSPAGYKVCARLYPNGDGVGRGTHLSFFFVVMKGEYDALLPWPFHQKVSLMLLDQHRSNLRDIVETFRPDPSSSSFQRPKQDMNIASGCPLFVPLSAISESSYLHDDTLYLKVVVHSHNLQAPDQP